MKLRRSWPDPERCTVEILVVPGCPGTQLAVARVREAGEELGLETNLRFVTIEGQDQAEANGFLGSPTIRVEGEDVEIGVEDRSPSLACRLYEHDGQSEKAPPVAWIRRALAASAPAVMGGASSPRPAAPQA
jgi:hypothetical protein